MGLGHVPQDPFRAEGAGADVQGRQRRGTAEHRDLGDQSRIARGRWGEDQAERWYRNHGYAIVERNWRVKEGEIDLIVAIAGLIVFSEVKTRATDAFGDPSLAVTNRKQHRLRRLAAIWLRASNVHGVDVRFDVVCVLGVQVRVIEDAF
ncbi:MAG: YraN family protein [Ilumatobacteraceae bacterium]